MLYNFHENNFENLRFLTIINYNKFMALIGHD